MEEASPHNHQPSLGPDLAANSASAQPGRPARTAHYPLDIPLPFERYEHRRLGPRDLMVYRIMNDFMNPRRARPKTYRSRIAYPSEFDPIKAQDYNLGMDLQVLRKMLFTSYAYGPDRPGNPTLTRTVADTLPRRPPFPFSAVRQSHTQCPGNGLPTLDDEIIDLVQRYYLEMEDPALRLFFDRVRPPRKRVGPVTDRVLAYSGTRAFVSRTLDRLINDYLVTARKEWSEADVRHLRNHRDRISSPGGGRALYDGGSFLPAIRGQFGRLEIGPRGSGEGQKVLHWALEYAERRYGVESLFCRVEGSQRYILQAPWRDDFSVYLPPWLDKDLKPYIVSIEYRSSIWASYFDSRARTDTPRRRDGRDVRQSRGRSRSEPRHGSLSVAILPFPSSDEDKAWLQILYPHMTLSQLDRRSRRRSLSRSRVADMFDRGGNRTETTAEPETQENGQVLHADPKAMGPGEAPSLSTPELQAPQQGGRLPRGKKTEGGKTRRAKPKRPGPCDNCSDTSHSVASCRAPCGHCGAPSPNLRQSLSVRGDWDAIRQGRLNEGYRSYYQDHHQQDLDEIAARASLLGPGLHNNPHSAPSCPLPRASRCKCAPFPVFHPAARCPVPCARLCGDPATPGSLAHPNAMTCRARCCMCGLQGHAGRDCRLRTCRCGGSHLGQDCSWKVECAVSGCFRFLCGVHCRGCGSTRKPFVDWRCVECRGRESGAAEGGEEEKAGEAAAVDGSGGGRGRGRKRGGRRKVDEDNKPKEKIAEPTRDHKAEPSVAVKGPGSARKPDGKHGDKPSAGPRQPPSIFGPPP